MIYIMKIMSFWSTVTCRSSTAKKEMQSHPSSYWTPSFKGWRDCWGPVSMIWSSYVAEISGRPSPIVPVFPCEIEPPSRHCCLILFWVPCGRLELKSPFVVKFLCWHSFTETVKLALLVMKPSPLFWLTSSGLLLNPHPSPVKSS